MSTDASPATKPASAACSRTSTCGAWRTPAPVARTSSRAATGTPRERWSWSAAAPAGWRPPSARPWKATGSCCSNGPAGSGANSTPPPPRRSGWHELRRDLVKALEQTAVDVRLGVTATREIIEREEPDMVIVATGAAPKTASWPVAAGLQVLDGVTVLVDQPGLAAPVVVAGGGCSGAQVAEAIAERSIAVTVVESTPDIARDAPLDERVRLLQRLARAGVPLLTETTIEAAGPQGVTITGKDGDQVLPAGSLVLCHGSRSETGLAASLKGLSATVIAVGDCVSPRRVADAVLEGALAALHLGRPEARGGPAGKDGPPIRLVSAGS